ncbi:MAG: hypothetical protein H6R26_554 [Proteobacteria bacterium]|nr:hypothetical protein [Pseudomonadota bacterium]
MWFTLKDSSRPVFAVVVVFCASFQAYADSHGNVGALISFATNYFYRGYSKSDNGPVLRANIDYEHQSGLYVGSWVSWIDFDDHGTNDRSDVEFYPYVGLVYKLADDLRIDGTVSRYIFNGKVFGQDADYNEYSFAIRYSDFLSASFAWADDAYHRGKNSINYEVSGRYPVTASVEASVGIGHNEALHLLEHNTLYWNAGFTWYFHRFGAVDLRYVDFVQTATSDHPSDLQLPYADPRFVFSISAGF